MVLLPPLCLSSGRRRRRVIVELIALGGMLGAKGRELGRLGRGHAFAGGGSTSRCRGVVDEVGVDAPGGRPGRRGDLDGAHRLAQQDERENEDPEEDSVLATVEKHGQVDAVAQERGADKTVDDAAAGVQFGGHQCQNDHADSADEQRRHIEAEHVLPFTIDTSGSTPLILVVQNVRARPFAVSSSYSPVRP